MNVKFLLSHLGQLRKAAEQASQRHPAARQAALARGLATSSAAGKPQRPEIKQSPGRSLKRALPFACAALHLSSLPFTTALSAQEISVGESLRDRSRVLQKKNPVSSETGGFSHLDGPDARFDAEGVEPIERFWQTRLPEGEKTTLAIGVDYGALPKDLAFTWKLERHGPLDEASHNKYPSGFAISIGESNTTRQFESLEYVWSEPRPDSELFAPSTIRADKRVIERENRFANALAQWQSDRSRFFATVGISTQIEADARSRLEYRFEPLLQASPEIYQYEGIRVDRNSNEASDIQTEKKIAAGADLTIADWLLQVEASYRDWSRDRPTTNTVRFQNRYSDPITLNIEDDERPALSTDISSAPLDEFAFRDNRFLDNLTEDEDLSFSVRAQRSGDLRSFKYNIDAGLFMREKTRRNEDIKHYYVGYLGNYTLNEVVNGSPKGTAVREAVDIGLQPNIDETDRHFQRNVYDYVFDEAASVADTFASRYDADEAITSAYAQLSLERDSWRLAGGLRYESTSLGTFGHESTKGEGTLPLIIPAYHDSKYDHLFPTLNANYVLNADVIFGASWQRTIARPNYYELIPYRIISHTAELLREGNPGLNPTVLDTSTVFVSGKIFKSSSVTLNLSQIKITDFILSVEDLLTTGPYSGFRNRTTLNGDTAKIDNVSLNWQSEFNLFNDFDKRLLFSINHQFRESAAKSEVVDQDGMILPEVAKHKSRASLSQTVGNFDWLLQADYQSRSLDKFGNIAETNEYLDDRLIASARFGYKLTNGWHLQSDFVNFNDAAQRESFGPSERISRVNYDSWQSRASLTKIW